MSPAKMLMLTGGLLLAAGLVLGLLERGVGTGHGWLWLGRLPGDIRIERPNFRFFFPLTTCLLASLALTALFWALRRWRP